jgi:hypothetical protein
VERNVAEDRQNGHVGSASIMVSDGTAYAGDRQSMRPGASLIGPAQFERRVFNAPPQAMTSSSGPGSRVGQRGGGRPITARPTGSNQVLATATLEPSSALLVIAPDHASRLLLIALGGWPRCRFDLGVDQALELSLALVAAVNSLGIQEIKFDGYRAPARGD